jgi:hypothetical protein
MLAVLVLAGRSRVASAGQIAVVGEQGGNKAALLG